jgi:hypothetical protein
MKRTVLSWDGREVRAFHKEGVEEHDLRSWLDGEYWDDEDRERHQTLKKVLEDPPVIVEVDDSEVEDGAQKQGDSVDVYLRVPRKRQRVLAFTLISKTVVEEDRFDDEAIVETFTTMVSDFESLTDQAVLAALYRWAGRDFVDVQLPSFKIHRDERETNEVKVEIAIKKERLASKYKWETRLNELLDLPEEIEESAMPEFEQAA